MGPAFACQETLIFLSFQNALTMRTHVVCGTAEHKAQPHQGPHARNGSACTLTPTGTRQYSRLSGITAEIPTTLIFLGVLRQIPTLNGNIVIFPTAVSLNAEYILAQLL